MLEKCFRKHKQANEQHTIKTNVDDNSSKNNKKLVNKAGA